MFFKNRCSLVHFITCFSSRHCIYLLNMRHIKHYKQLTVSVQITFQSTGVDCSNSSDYIEAQLYTKQLIF